MTDTDFAKQLMDDINPDLLDFLQHKVNSFIKWDLVRFFHDNPYAADTADNIARYISREERMIGAELEGLVRSGVLQAREISGLTIYSLAKNPEMRQLIEAFVIACNDRQFRVKAIYHVIRAMR